MPITVRSRQVTELLPTVRAGVRAAHLRAHHADDAVQQTLTALVPQLEKLSSMPEKERRAYVFISASRTAMGLRKRLGMEEAYGTDAEVADWAERNGVPYQRGVIATPEQEARVAEGAVRARRALSAMTTGTRQIVHAIAHDGLSEREAAEQLGMSRGGLAYRLRRAREALGRAWKGTTSWARGSASS